MIKVTTIKPGFFSREEVMTVRECKNGYPYLKDYRALKAALSEFRRVKMEDATQ